jgi:branched-chain amino acid transport system substrate-binding protein
MSRPRARLLALTAFTAASALAVAACGGTTSATNSASISGGGNAITIGISEPLTGAFATDGLATKQGFQLWASDVNANGGLLGHQVKLTILNDNSLPSLTAKQYNTLIGTDHVNFVLGPFSSLLTSAAAPVVARYGYAFSEGSGGAPAIFALNEHNIFATSVPVVNQMVPFARWVAGLPASQRPKKAAYPMVLDPFADPPVKTAQAILQNAGVQTVYSNASNPITATTAAGLTPYARAVVASKPDMVVLGSVDVPTVTAFIKVFQQVNYLPKIFIAAAGPDQGQAFVDQVGPANASGIMVPDGWYGGFPDALSHVMVQDYIAKFGGTTSGVNADVAESYSAGEVLADAVKATSSLDNAKIIAYLHSGVTLQTVQGPAKFDSIGENTAATAFIFQWQNGQFLQVLPVGSAGSSPIEATKPPWLTRG